MEVVTGEYRGPELVVCVPVYSGSSGRWTKSGWDGDVEVAGG